MDSGRLSEDLNWPRLGRGEHKRQPEAAIRQQMSLLQDDEAKTKYDFISFIGPSAALSRKMRGAIAHLHVALGHIGADKPCRMLPSSIHLQ